MPGESFRFIHASDFHLDVPLGDLDSLPEHLKSKLVRAPWAAAEAVFEAAVVENVDFVVLCGDLLHPSSAGARGLAFLIDQFEQLGAQGINVFWATGQADDPTRMPSAVTWPSNVTIFKKDATAQIPVARAGEVLALICGRSSDGRAAIHAPSFRHEPTELYTIASGYGVAEPTALADSRFDYWALGGEHQPKTLQGAANHAARYPGSPQARGLAESGPHGFLLVDVDADKTTRVHFVESDVIRYRRIQLDEADLAASQEIRSTLASRISRLQNENGDRDLIIAWQLQPGGGEVASAVGDPSALQSALRRDFGHGSPAAWTTQVEVIPPAKFPQSWYDEDTILGDFLRSVDEHRKSAGRDFALAPVIGEHPGLDPSAASLLGEIAPQDRAAALNRATLLGVELLRGGKPALVAAATKNNKRAG